MRLLRLPIGARHRWRRIAVLGLSAVLGGAMAGGAAERPVIATPGSAAVVALPAPTAGEAPAGRPPASSGKGATMVIDVLSFQPPPQGSVQAVVTVKSPSTGAVQEIGRFGLFPNSAFKAATRDAAQSFRLTLDPAATDKVQQQGQVSVGLVPFGGSGDGAQLEIGKIDLQPK
jgi:hypothetical protein